MNKSEKDLYLLTMFNTKINSKCDKDKNFIFTDHEIEFYKQKCK